MEGGGYTGTAVTTSMGPTLDWNLAEVVAGRVPWLYNEYNAPAPIVEVDLPYQGFLMSPLGERIMRDYGSLEAAWYVRENTPEANWSADLAELRHPANYGRLYPWLEYKEAQDRNPPV